MLRHTVWESLGQVFIWNQDLTLKTIFFSFLRQCFDSIVLKHTKWHSRRNILKWNRLRKFKFLLMHFGRKNRVKTLVLFIKLVYRDLLWIKIRQKMQFKRHNFLYRNFFRCASKTLIFDDKIFIFKGNPCIECKVSSDLNCLKTVSQIILF